MESINLISLAVFILFALIGAVAHWGKKKRRGEVQGNLVGYLFADSPGKTGMTVIVIVGAAITAATTGALDGLDVAVAWAYLQVGNIPMPTAHALIAAFTLGWAADSGINKGGQP
jgi:hypothetical protein